jgi:hypothetical protein
MKRPWYYENGVWKTSGVVDQKELDDWAAFYGHDFQGTLALADKGKIPMWFSLGYTLHQYRRANRTFKRELVKEANRICEPWQRFFARVYRRTS